MSQVGITVAEPARRSRGRRRRVPVLIVCCMIVVVAVVAFALAGTQIAPRDPNAQDLLAGLTKPSAHSWLGTDDLGRDIFSRVIVGSRTALVGPC